MSDGTIYITISQGYGTMPPLRENLNPRERWDVVNYVKTLSQ
jgi:mono/diheme cytochrome c family protein